MKSRLPTQNLIRSNRQFGQALSTSECTRTAHTFLCLLVAFLFFGCASGPKKELEGSPSQFSGPLEYRVYEAAKAHLVDVYDCYGALIKKDACFSGKLQILISFSSEGRVLRVDSDKQRSTIENTPLMACISEKAANWLLPASEFREITATYTYKFSCTGHEVDKVEILAPK